MAEPIKPQTRKRKVVGWRQLERARLLVRARQRSRPKPL